MPPKRWGRPSRSFGVRLGNGIGEPSGSSGDGVTNTLDAIAELVQQQIEIAQQQADTTRILATMMARLPDNVVPDNNTIPSPPVIPPPADDRWLYKRFWDCNPKPFKGFLNPKSRWRVDKWTGENFCGDVCTDEEKYRLAIFSLQGDAHIWWKSIERIYATNDHQLNRTVFLDKVDQNYIPKVVRDKKVSEFIHFIQGGWIARIWSEVCWSCPLCTAGYQHREREG